MNNANAITRMRYLFWPLMVLGVFALALVLVINQPVRQYLPGTVKEYLRFFEKVSISDLRVCLCNPEKDIKIKRDDGLELSGSLYGLTDEVKRPGIVLLHGRTNQGRKLPIYRILATKLEEKGYTVLTIDFAGFGESDDPFHFGTIDALNPDKDVYAALHYLDNITNVDPERLYLIGHSRGAPPVLSVGQKDDRIKKIVAIGPPRRITERINDLYDQSLMWERNVRIRQELYGESFPSWFTQEVWAEQIISYFNIESYLNYFSSPSHKPLLLIDGELESEKDKKYLAWYTSQLAEPKYYITISNADHYSNTTRFGGINFYDVRAVGDMVDLIDRWLKGNEKSSAIEIPDITGL